MILGKNLYCSENVNAIFCDRRLDLKLNLDIMHCSFVLGMYYNKLGFCLIIRYL